MTARAELVERWQSQLAESEEQVGSAPIRLRWLWTMRVRLYRFLLLCYGDGEWNSDERALDIEPTYRPLVDHLPADCGRKPKSAERISATLYSVQCAVDRVMPLGPLTAGVYKDEWIRVAIFRHRNEAVEFCKWLKEAEIGSRYIRDGSRLAIEVHRADFDAALAGYYECRAMFAAVRQRRAVARHAAWLELLFIFGNLALVIAVGATLSQDLSLAVDERKRICVTLGLASLVCLALATPVLLRLISFHVRPTNDKSFSKVESE